MRLIIIPVDKFISIDGQGLSGIQQDLSWIPSNVHAVQWYDTYGEVEYKDGTPNERIEELGIFQQAIDDYNKELEIISNKPVPDPAPEPEPLTPEEKLEAAGLSIEELKQLLGL